MVLHTYADVLEARMIQDVLKENGIESLVNDENVMGMDPIGGTEIRVFEKDKAEAERIIQQKSI